jgi:hypothetical protein
MMQSTGIKTMPDDTTKISGRVPAVSWAYSQFRDSGILFAPANGKLYFEFLKIFSVPENTCPCGC